MGATEAAVTEVQVCVWGGSRCHGVGRSGPVHGMESHDPPWLIEFRCHHTVAIPSACAPFARGLGAQLDGRAGHGTWALQHGQYGVHTCNGRERREAWQ